MRPSLGNYLKEINDIESREEKIRIMQGLNNKLPSLSALLQIAFNSNIEFVLPDEKLNVQLQTIPHDLEGTLIVGLKKIDRFLSVDGVIQQPQINPKRKKELFEDWLGEMPEEDQILMESIKDKKMPDHLSNITWELVNEAFPGILGSEPKKAKRHANKKTEIQSQESENS
jgi:hypothetical protein